jgi:hypothetical protein
MQKIMNQAQRAGAALVRNTDHAAELITSEYTAPAIDIQLFRAAWLARRVPLSPQIALFVASLHFGESAR